MVFETIIYEKIDNVAKITMNRPEVRNAESRQMSKEIAEAFSLAEEDDDVRVIILAGAGSSFSAGHDLGSAAAVTEREKSPRIQSGSYEGYLQEEDRFLKPYLHIRDMPKPTIAQVHGYCIMGGLILATMCDLIIASEDAQFAERAVRAGGAAVEYFSHPWEFGIRKAKELLFTGDYIGAHEAWRLGMVNRVVPREKLEEETMELAKRIALQHPASLKFIKQAVNYVQDLMGFRQSLVYFFNVHQFTHAYRAMMPGVGYDALRGDGGSVRDLIRARDEKFEKKE